MKASLSLNESRKAMLKNSELAASLDFAESEEIFAAICAMVKL
jgi:hypothetical protein